MNWYDIEPKDALDIDCRTWTDCYGPESYTTNKTVIYGQ